MLNDYPFLPMMVQERPYDQFLPGLQLEFHPILVTNRKKLKEYVVLANVHQDFFNLKAMWQIFDKYYGPK